MCMAEVVKADILDVGLATDPMPEREGVTARSGRVERGREHEWAAASRLPFEDASRR